ncbi:MAG: hypothetical protein FWH20_00930 [Oscillospiraceae bacterium]|nr:hypothetical protein [Oscillospiraceae bacterium]
MPTTGEKIEQLARENTIQQILLAIEERELTTVEEVKAYLLTLLAGKKL